jgi:hypothetical protein
MKNSLLSHPKSLQPPSMENIFWTFSSVKYYFQRENKFGKYVSNFLSEGKKVYFGEKGVLIGGGALKLHEI